MVRYYLTLSFLIIFSLPRLLALSITLTSSFLIQVSVFFNEGFEIKSTNYVLSCYHIKKTI